MPMENQLAHAITQTEYDSSYDKAAKKLLANKQILAQIMKNCVNAVSYTHLVIADESWDMTTNRLLPYSGAEREWNLSVRPNAVSYTHLAAGMKSSLSFTANSSASTIKISQMKNFAG